MLVRILIASCLAVSVAAEHLRAADYVVVVSRATEQQPEWRDVVSALVAKHQAQTRVYEKQVEEVLDGLRADFPRHVCFVATREEAGRDFVAAVHRLTRRLDDDPFPDALWGIVTGYDAANALRIARTTEPLQIERVAAGTELAMDRVREGVWYCELKQHRMVRKSPGVTAEEQQGPADTTQALADSLNEYQPGLFVTSGHATERDWQLGFAYPNGSFQSKAGELIGVDTQRKRIPIHSDNPKVYMAVGNCLMGHIDGPDAMALAWMNSAGVHQMMGYTVLTWYGYAGWGCLDYFVEQPGRYSFAEAFLANQIALVDRLERYFPAIARRDTAPGSYPRFELESTDAARRAGLTPQDAAGLLHDRDVLAFYGDPGWDARMAPGSLSYDQDLREVQPGVFEFTVHPRRGKQSYEPVNRNGSQRGGRPMVQFFPKRLKNVQIQSGQHLQPVLTDDFILVPNPYPGEDASDQAGPGPDVDQPLTVRFTAERMVGDR